MNSKDIKKKSGMVGNRKHMVYFCTRDGNRFLTEVVSDDMDELYSDTWPDGGVSVVLIGEEFMGTDMYGVTVTAHREHHGPPVVFENAQGRGDVG
jgi:hypothetical protein